MIPFAHLASAAGRTRILLAFCFLSHTLFRPFLHLPLHSHPDLLILRLWSGIETFFSLGWRRDHGRFNGATSCQ